MITKLSDLQSYFSLPQFDEIVVNSCQHGKYTDAYRLGLQHIESDLTAYTVPNFLPLVYSDKGDVMGYYFPKKDRGKPFVAVQYRSSDMELFPMNSDLGAIFSKPQIMEDADDDLEGEGGGNWTFLEGCVEWEDLVIAPNNEVVELRDLLKPMSLNWRFLMNLDPKSKGLLPGGEVLFGKARDFFEADCWLELADYMESEDDVVGSVKALENAIAVLWRYPDYGGYQIEKVPAECKEIWERIASLEGLDGFDIALSQCMLRSFEKRAAR